MQNAPSKETRAWVTVVGWSPMAVINTLWHACEQGIVPTHIYLLRSPQTPQIEQSLKRVERYLQALLPEFGVADPQIEVQSIDEDDLRGFRQQLNRTLLEARRQCEKVVLDITAGRKYMSAFGLSLGLRADIGLEKLYYNQLLDQRYQDEPHPLIPRHHQQLYDLLEVLK